MTLQKILDYGTTICSLGLAIIHGLSTLPANPSLENWITTIGLAVFGFFAFKQAS